MILVGQVFLKKFQKRSLKKDVHAATEIEVMLSEVLGRYHQLTDESKCRERGKS